MLATRFPSNILVKLLGVWEVHHVIQYNMFSELTVIVRCSPWKTPQLIATYHYQSVKQCPVSYMCIPKPTNVTNGDGSIYEFVIVPFNDGTTSL